MLDIEVTAPLWGLVVVCIGCASAGGAIVAVIVGGAADEAHERGCERGYRQGFADGTGWDDLEDRDAR